MDVPAMMRLMLACLMAFSVPASLLAQSDLVLDLGTGPVTPNAPARGDIVIDLGRGPVTVHVPPSYDPETATPLVMLLHGYGSSGPQQEAYMQFLPLSEEFGFLYLYPDGTADAVGRRFWNATDACCNFFGSNVDDSGYLQALIDEIKTLLNVDPRRVHIIGHSNGGFMAYRMACDHADVIASIAGLAGATFNDPADCTPAAPVHVLQIHGTADNTILFDGGCIGNNCYPGAIQSVEQWADYDGCSLVANRSAPPIDLVADIPGDETTVTRYRSDCLPGGSGELWTMVGGGHVPVLSESFSRLVVEYLLAHPKPSSVLGDLNCDGRIDALDIEPFILALFDPDEYPIQFPVCDINLADINGDGSIDALDIEPFLGLLFP